MFNLDRGVERKRGELRMHGVQDSQGVRRAVKEIRIAKGDVLRPGRYLPSNILQHHLRRTNAESPLINRYHRAVAAQMLAPAAAFAVSHHSALAADAHLG